MCRLLGSLVVFVCSIFDAGCLWIVDANPLVDNSDGAAAFGSRGRSCYKVTFIVWNSEIFDALVVFVATVRHRASGAGRVVDLC